MRQSGDWRSQERHVLPAQPRRRRHQGAQARLPMLPAVEGRVADVAACYEIDYVFGYVCGVVADAFEILGDEDQLEGGEDLSAVFHHVGQEFAEELVAEAVNLIVAAEDALREVLIAAD